MIAYQHAGEPPEYEGKSNLYFEIYRMRTAQCLQSGDISKCFPYTVETLRFNATQEVLAIGGFLRALYSLIMNPPSSTEETTTVAASGSCAA